MSREENLAEMVKEVLENAEELASAFESMIEEGKPVHQVVVDAGEMVRQGLERAMGINATLFELKPDETERKMRLELDTAFRLELDTISKLMRLPRRTG